MTSSIARALTRPLPLLAAAALAGCGVTPRVDWAPELHAAITDHGGGFEAAPALLDGLQPVTPDQELAPGDQLLFGVRLENGDSEQIWYLRLSVVSKEIHRWLEIRGVAAFEQRVVRASDGHSLPGGYVATHREPEPSGEAAPADATSGNGAEHEASEREPLDLNDFATDTSFARIRVEAFDGTGEPLGTAESDAVEWRLREGLLPACEAGYRLREVMAGRLELGEDAELLELTDEQFDDVHTAGAGTAACRTFFRILRSNPVTRDILWEVIALPSLWSMLTEWGVRPSMSVDFFDVLPVAPNTFASTDRQLWSVPVTLLLNEQPALHAQLLVGPSGTPDGTAAGVFGVVGSHPSDPDRRVFVQLLGSRRGTPADARP